VHSHFKTLFSCLIFLQPLVSNLHILATLAYVVSVAGAGAGVGVETAADALTAIDAVEDKKAEAATVPEATGVVPVTRGVAAYWSSTK